MLQAEATLEMVSGFAPGSRAEAACNQSFGLCTQAGWDRQLACRSWACAVLLQHLMRSCSLYCIARKSPCKMLCCPGKRQWFLVHFLRSSQCAKLTGTGKGSKLCNPSKLIPLPGPPEVPLGLEPGAAEQGCSQRPSRQRRQRQSALPSAVHPPLRWPPSFVCQSCGCSTCRSMLEVSQ